MRAMISGLGHYVPPKRLTNQDLEQMVDTTDEWIRTRTGIQERRILDSDKGSSYMAVRAAQQVLDQRGISADDLDLILVATVTPDMPVPSTAALVQRDLGAGACWGYDINGGCSGFIYALATGAQFVESGKHQRVLVVGADKMSSIINYTDRNTCVIFGDGAGAVLLEPSDDADVGVWDFDLHMDGAGQSYLHVCGGGSLNPACHETVEKNMHYVYQEGRVVYKHAITGMSEVSARLMKRHGLRPADIRLLIPHQANVRIIEGVAKKLGLAPEQVLVNIENYGNTTAATIPIAMSEAFAENKMARGDWIVLSAFGAGFTWGSVLLRWAMESA